MGFFDYVFDSEGQQRRDINHATREAEIGRFHGAVALENLEQLTKQVLMQRTQIRDLSALVSVLVRMLAETATVDEKVLRYRVEAEIEALDEAARLDDLIKCVKCGERVKPVYTSVTDEGPVCDHCMAKG